MASDSTEFVWLEAVAEPTRAALQFALAETRATEEFLDNGRESFFGPTHTCAPGPLWFFHGTSWENAEAIERDGFIPSEAGCLGPGVYIVRCDKALRFARDAGRHGGDEGGLVKVRVTIRNPKFVSGDDETWQQEGYDACRADHTSRSDHMEWCVADHAQLAVLGITRIPIDAATALPPPAELPPAVPLERLSLESLREHERAAEASASTSAAVGGADESNRRRQFHCPKHGLFWARVRSEAKQVAHCRSCDALSNGKL